MDSIVGAVIIVVVVGIFFVGVAYFDGKRSLRQEEKRLKEMRSFQSKQASAARRSQSNQNKIVLKTLESVMEKSKIISEMAMAGSLQEWKRIKQGKRSTNAVAPEPNFDELSENNKIPFSQITGVQVDGGPKQKIKLYK